MNERVNTVTVLNASGRITAAVAAELKRAAEASTKRFTADLGICGIDVVLTTEYHGLSIQELAIGGYAPSAGVVFIDLEPENPQFVHWKDRLPSIVAHELNHAARWRTAGYGQTFLDALVSEGLATVYEAQMTDQVPPYARANRNFSELWREAYPLLDRTDYGHATWFFGEGHLPRWTGYSLGYEMVHKHLAAEGISIHEATNLPASDFLLHARTGSLAGGNPHDH